MRQRLKALCVGLASLGAIASAHATFDFKRIDARIAGARVQVFVVKDNGKGSTAQWMALPAADHPNPGMSVPELAARESARLAVNANFYREDEPGRQVPIGLVLHQMRIFALPNRFYPTVGVLDGKLEWDKVELRVGAGLAEDKLGPARLVLYPPRMLKNAVFFSGDLPRAGVHDYMVAKKGDQANWAVQLTSPSLAAPLQGATKVSVQISLVGERFGERWQNVPEAVSGSHVLTAASSYPDVGKPWALSRQPRTFIGVDADGRGWGAVFDGRREQSQGVSVKEGWEFLRKTFGASWALNLDGGGSTTIIYSGRLANKPSDGFPRAVAVGFGARY